MEEIPAHVHSGPIVPDVLIKQHEHRSVLIWSGDHETCFTDLQCRRFGRSLFQCYSTAPRSHMLPDFSGNLVHVRYLSLLEDIDAIRTYSWGSCVLGFLHRHAIWCTFFDCSQLPTHKLTSMLQEVDNMASVVIQEPPSSPT
ncbi:hypothetical protein M9H77_26853 [Catharanthus roseus]|uniref:Uncharacterized protein n=1 Tax=Catharanthus roseus TaxID=4058 RepID=A0ACC0AB31_CATRO|nr:hypothetical protein M9H77_26853 [Catharanthus roseus]